MFYLFIFLVLVSFINIDINYTQQRKVGLSILFLMFIICALRGETVCVDTKHYIIIFQNNELSTRFGLLYSIIEIISRTINNSPHTFLFLVALVTYLPLFWIIKQESQKPVLSVLLYLIITSLYLETFNIIRQMASVSYFLLSVFFLEKKEYIKTGIFIVLAFLFHKIVIIFLPILFLSKLKINYKILSSLLVISFFVGILGWFNYTTYLFELGVSIFDSQEVGSVGRIINHYYKTDEFAGEWNIVGKLVNSLPLTAITLIIIYCFNKKDRQFICSKYLYYLNILVFGIVTLNLFASSVFTARVASFMTVSIILVLPYVYHISGRKEKLLFKVSIAGIAFLFIISLWKYQNDPYSLGVLPYFFCFE